MVVEADGGSRNTNSQLGVFGMNNGVITATGDRIDMGFVIGRIEFVPSGGIAIVLGEDGEVATVDVTLDALTVLDRTIREPRFDDPPTTENTLPGAGYGDLTITKNVEAEGVVVYATGSNPVVTAGVAKLLIACDGQITIDVDAHYGLRLAYSMALLPSGRGLLFGGDVSGFAPHDTHDVRVLDLGTTTTEFGGFDVLSGFLGATRIAAFSDGTFALVPNFSIAESAFSPGIVQLAISPSGAVSALPAVLNGGPLQSPAEAVIAPDNTVAAVSDWKADAVHIIDVVGGDAPRIVNTLNGIGLAEQMALIKAGPPRWPRLCPRDPWRWHLRHADRSARRRGRQRHIVRAAADRHSRRRRSAALRPVDTMAAMFVAFALVGALAADATVTKVAFVVRPAP